MSIFCKTLWQLEDHPRISNLAGGQYERIPEEATGRAFRAL